MPQDRQARTLPADSLHAGCYSCEAGTDAAPKEEISIRTSYNIAGTSFAPCDLTAAIKAHLPEFRITYEPDHLNAITNSWPASIKDIEARRTVS